MAPGVRTRRTRANAAVNSPLLTADDLPNPRRTRQAASASRETSAEHDVEKENTAPIEPRPKKAAKAAKQTGAKKTALNTTKTAPKKVAKTAPKKKATRSAPSPEPSPSPEPEQEQPQESQQETEEEVEPVSCPTKKQPVDATLSVQEEEVDEIDHNAAHSPSPTPPHLQSQSQHRSPPHSRQGTPRSAGERSTSPDDQTHNASANSKRSPAASNSARSDLPSSAFSPSVRPPRQRKKAPKEVQPDNLETRAFRSVPSRNIKKKGSSNTPKTDRETSPSPLARISPTVCFTAFQPLVQRLDFDQSDGYDVFMRKKKDHSINQAIEIDGGMVLLWCNTMVTFGYELMHFGRMPEYKGTGPERTGDGHHHYCSCTCGRNRGPHENSAAPWDPEPFECPDSPEDSESEEDPEPPQESEPGEDAEPGEDTEPPEYAEPLEESGPPEEPEPPKDAQLSEDPEPLEEANPPEDAEPLEDSELSELSDTELSELKRRLEPSGAPKPPSQTPKTPPKTPQRSFKIPDSSPAFSISSSDDSDTDKPGSKRKRKSAETETRKRRVSRELPNSTTHTITLSHGQYYEDGNVILNATEAEKARAIDLDHRGRNKAASDEGSESPSDEEEEEEEESNVEDDEELDENNTPTRPAARPASRRGNSRLSTGSTDNSLSIISASSEYNQAPSTEPARGSFRMSFGSFGSGLGRLFRTPLSMFSSPARGAIPNFSEPPTQAASSGPPPQAENVARPLFRDSKPPRKASKTTKGSKASKAKRQEASDYQVDLSRRKAAAQAIAESKTKAEDIEAEIERRVQEELAIAKRSLQQTPQQPSSQSPEQGSKRKRPSPGCDSPGSTPHSRKSARLSLREGSSDVEPSNHTGGFGVPETDSEEEVHEPSAKRVKFANKTESLTTPDKGSQLFHQQQRRPPGDELPRFGYDHSQHRSIIKQTDYDSSVGYDANRDACSYQAAEESDIMDEQPQQPDRPHEFGVSSFNSDGDFQVPGSPESDSSEEIDEDELAKTAGSTPMPKRTTTRAPPPPPQPIHATLPAPTQSSPTRSPPNQSSPSQSEAITAARARANQYTPKQPSRLRESTNVTHPPSAVSTATSTATTTERPQPSSARVTSPVARGLQEYVRSQQESDQENMAPGALLEDFVPHKIPGANFSAQMRRDMDEAFEKFWPEAASTVVKQVETGIAEYQQSRSTGLGF